VKRSEEAPVIVKTEIKVTPRNKRFEDEATMYHYQFKKFVPIFLERKRSRYITIKDEKVKHASD